ncbi:MAG: HEAT repeat domain-containing protein, partial [Chitinispirillia bacterium]|nr:HEAT repeat domain-containing protein [Chitinispirillia bacterium]
VKVRLAAAQELRMAPRDERVVPLVLKACIDEDPDVRMNGFFALGKMDPNVEGVIPVLFDGLRDTVLDVRRAVVSALSELNPFPNVLFPPLTKLLVDEDEKIRKLVHTAFADMQGAGIGSLIRALNDKDPQLRLAAIATLETIGPLAKNALVRLRKVAEEDSEEEVKEAAKKAIKKIE